jgi:hypothetical protein
MPLINQQVNQSGAILDTSTMGGQQNQRGIFVRSPIPPIGLGSVDNLRQFYNGSNTPQFRVQMISAAFPYGSTNGTSTTSTIVETGGSASGGGSSSGGTTVPISLGRVFTASITTPTLNPGGSYQTTLILAKTYGVISLAVNAPARVRLYTSNHAATADAGRPTTVPIQLGINTGLVGDWLLQSTSEFQWFSSPMAIGFNADEPASTNGYVVVTNPVSTSAKIQISITYVQMEA